MSFPPTEMVREIKRALSNFVNEKKWFNGKFQRQAGDGCFASFKSQTDNVIKNALNQKEHRPRITFRKEYLAFLTKSEVPFNQRYLFEIFD